MENCDEISGSVVSNIQDDISQCFVRREIEEQAVMAHRHVLEPINFALLPIIPSIDIKVLLLSTSGDEATDYELQKLHSACKNWGIFQLMNHGVSSSLLDKLKDEIEGFYKLPLEDRMKYKMIPGDSEGYGAILVPPNQYAQNLDWRDTFFFIHNPPRRRKPHLFPELPSSLRNTLELYFMELQKIAMTLLRVLGKALKITDMEEIVEEMFEVDGMQSMRMTYYPPCPHEQEMAINGFAAHSDATSTITILNQLNRVDGPQIKKDGVWIPVKLFPNALVVIVGDILEILSNGIYHSIEHRVRVNSEQERMSIAMFFNPKLDAEIGPITSLIENPPLFKRIGMENYIKLDFFARKHDGKSHLEQLKIENDQAHDTTI